MLSLHFAEVRRKLCVPWTPPDSMSEYLASTPLCNMEDPAVQAAAVELVADVQSPQQAAMRIFSYVRDQIKFGLVHPMGETAAMTLARGVGQCSAKTNLRVTLLRIVQIPARYHLVAVDRTCLRGLVPGALYKLFTSSLWHPWAECYIDRRWIGCDTLIDQQLYFSAVQQGIIDVELMPTIDWDGSNELRLLEPWILEEVDILSRLEIGLARMPTSMVPPKSLARVLFAISNRYTDKLRRMSATT